MRRQPVKCSNLIVEQISGLFGIVEGIVQFFRLELIILQQVMVRPVREKQRG